ncbi:hypothetical protein V5799_010593 [Amblyomma americanum]|uniref:Secreted protein n=1 Tax=Amblyomma americanum TaxID=6943 RepID=A0AAQ4EJL9_AMBAM
MQTLLLSFWFVTQLLVLTYPWCAVFAPVPLELTTSEYGEEDHDLPAAACGLPVHASLPATVGTPAVLSLQDNSIVSASIVITYKLPVLEGARQWASESGEYADVISSLHFRYPVAGPRLSLVRCLLSSVLGISTLVYADEYHGLPPAARGLPVLASQTATVGTPPVLSLQDNSIISASIVIIYKLPVLKCARQWALESGKDADAASSVPFPYPVAGPCLCLVGCFFQVPLELLTPEYGEEDHDLPAAARGLPVLASQPATVGTPPVLSRQDNRIVSASIVIISKLPVLNGARQWASESGKDADAPSSVLFRCPVAGPRLSL